jgi:ATP-dependent Clp protease ATP-binding subunit ClpA
VFERFTESARQVVVLGQDEARHFRHHHIGTEHLLLGLLREQEGVAAHVLEALGASLDDVRERIATIVGQGERPTPGQIPFTPRAKRALEESSSESRALGRDTVGTEHVLLGLTHDHTALACRILAELGADREKIRAVVQRSAAEPPSRPRREDTPRPAPVPGARPPDWEYRVERLERVDELTQAWLDERGAEGWELSAALPVSDGVQAVFKRRRPPDRPPPPPRPR